MRRVVFVLSCGLGACRVADENFVVRGDAAADTSCAMMWPFPPSNFDPCANDFPPSQGAYTLSGTIDIDTTGSAYHGVRLLHVDHLNVPANTTLTGTLPIVIVSESDVMVAASIDVSRLASDATSCGISAGSSDPVDSGGGPGGGMGFDGGRGGAAQPAMTQTPGGHFAGNASLIPLVAGCPGGASGQVGSLQAAPGNGGGGIEISTRTSITFTPAGAIFADGAGGAGGLRAAGIASGGGGGGSGGAIYLEADVLVLPVGAQLCAVGGAGGEGASTGANASPGHGGGDAAGCAAGQAMSNAFGGLRGGDGSANGPGMAGGDGLSGDAGGGGGGAAGIIHIYGHSMLQNMGATIKPAATP